MRSYPLSSQSNGSMVARVVFYIPKILNLIISLLLSDQHRQFNMIRYAEYNSTPPNNTPPLYTQFPPENTIRNQQIGGTPLRNASIKFPTTSRNSTTSRQLHVTRRWIVTQCHLLTRQLLRVIIILIVQLKTVTTVRLALLL